MSSNIDDAIQRVFERGMRAGVDLADEFGVESAKHGVNNLGRDTREDGDYLNLQDRDRDREDEGGLKADDALDERPRYIHDGGERTNAELNDYIDGEMLADLLNDMDWPTTLSRRQASRLVDSAMTDSDDGDLFDAEAWSASLPLQLQNVSREEFEARVDQFAGEVRGNSMLRMQREEFERSLDPITGEPRTPRGRAIGEKHGWIDDDDVDPTLAKDAAQQRANANEERTLEESYNRLTGGHESDRHGSNG